MGHGSSALVHVQKWQMEGFSTGPSATKTSRNNCEALTIRIPSSNPLSNSSPKNATQQAAMQELLRQRTDVVDTMLLGNKAVLKLDWYGCRVLTTAEYSGVGECLPGHGDGFQRRYIDWSHCLNIGTATNRQTRTSSSENMTFWVTK